MLPERVALVFDNAIVDGKPYINHTVVIDDLLTITVVMDILNTIHTDIDGRVMIDANLSVAFADTLADRYKIPEYYEKIDYYVVDKKRMI